MDLPKNITQVGEWSTSERVYVEDYVISYMKQLRVVAKEKETAIALYGNRKEEEDKSYLFVYGAAKLDFLQKETRHLSQAQKQEIERFRIKFFPEFVFLGYGVLNGDMVDGFYISEQEVCRYIAGYAQFYEKNDAMLAYMLEERKEEAEPEVVEQEKFLRARQRTENRKLEQEEKTSGTGREFLKEKYRAQLQKGEKTDKKIYWKGVAVAGGLGAVALLYFNKDTGWGNALDSFNQRQLPEIVETGNMRINPETEESAASALSGDVHIGYEDVNEEPFLQENSADQGEEENLQYMKEGEEELTDQYKTDGNETETGRETVTETVTEIGTQTKEEKENVQEVFVNMAEAGNEEKEYIIKKGDTLSGISWLHYGTDRRVTEICSLNNIKDPDDIKIGQKIILP